MHKGIRRGSELKNSEGLSNIVLVLGAAALANYVFAGGRPIYSFLSNLFGF